VARRKVGSYILLIELSQSQKIVVGALGAITFPRGFYAYVGSAMGGLKSRINYHLREKESPHWHIDYLLKRAQVIQVIFCEMEERVECALAQTLAEGLISAPGFGCTDCKCRSHLYFGEEEDGLRAKIIQAFNELGVPYQVMDI
jgi:Uri superfamily endonuclease